MITSGTDKKKCGKYETFSSKVPLCSLVDKFMCIRLEFINCISFKFPVIFRFFFLTKHGKLVEKRIECPKC